MRLWQSILSATYIITLKTKHQIRKLWLFAFHHDICMTSPCTTFTTRLSDPKMTKRPSKKWSAICVLALPSACFLLNAVVLVEGFNGIPNGRSISLPAMTRLPSSFHRCHSHVRNPGVVGTRGTVRSIQQSGTGRTPSSTMLRQSEITAPAPSPDKLPVKSAIFSLIKAIVGSGVLALPSGVAAMSNHKIA
jgi:hypothetical protein